MAKKGKFSWKAYYRSHKKEYAAWGKAYRAGKHNGKKGRKGRRSRK